MGRNTSGAVGGRHYGTGQRGLSSGQSQPQGGRAGTFGGRGTGESGEPTASIDVSIMYIAANSAYYRVSVVADLGAEARNRPHVFACAPWTNPR